MAQKTDCWRSGPGWRADRRARKGLWGGQRCSGSRVQRQLHNSMCLSEFTELYQEVWIYWMELCLNKNSILESKPSQACNLVGLPHWCRWEAVWGFTLTQMHSAANGCFFFLRSNIFFHPLKAKKLIDEKSIKCGPHTVNPQNLFWIFFLSFLQIFSPKPKETEKPELRTEESPEWALPAFTLVRRQNSSFGKLIKSMAGLPKWWRVQSWSK